MKKINVLDKGYLELLDYMGKDLTIANVARVSFGKESKKLSKKETQLIHYLAEHEHTSPFRHVILQFRIKAPIFVERQLQKHLIGSDYTYKDTAWNSISGRYVEYAHEIHIPQNLRKSSPKIKQGSLSESIDSEATFMNSLKLHYQQAMSLYNDLLIAGVCKEQAREVLPLGLYTEWIWTASLQAVAHLIHLRTDPHAQRETQEYGKAFYDLTKEKFPVSLDCLLNTKEHYGKNTQDKRK